MAVLAVIVAASSLLLASTAPTTSTIMSHLDASTGTCIRRAAAEKRICKLREPSATCRANFQAALAACFSAGAGVACASACVAEQHRCEVQAHPAVAACRQDRRTRDAKNARAACDVPLDDCKRGFAACLPACAQG
jgi:hypothetical protein